MPPLFRIVIQSNTGSRIVQVLVVGRDQVGNLAGGHFLQERIERGDQLLEIGVLVGDHRGQRTGGRIVELFAFRVVEQFHQLPAARLERLVQAGIVDLDAGHLVAPAGGLRLAIEPMHEVIENQRLEVLGIAVQRAVAGFAAQRHHRAHQPVDVLPDKLLERFGIAPARHIVGDPGGDFGDAREIADRVVARRALRIAEVKEMELPHPPGALGLGVDAAKHVGVALRVEHDDGFTAPNVLRHQQFQKPRLAGAGGTDHHHVSYPLRQRQVDVTFVGLNTVERRIAPHLGHRRHRIPPGRPAGQRGCPREPGVLMPQLEPARQAIEPSRLAEMRVFRPARVDQALGMHRGPAEAAAEKELVAGPGDALGGQHVVRRLPEVALKAQHALRLHFAAQRVRK